MISPRYLSFVGELKMSQCNRLGSQRIESPPSITITAQNIFDNGELNDHRKSAFDASWSEKAPRVILEMLEFEGSVTEVWPRTSHSYFF